jgi:hypothetical protein
VSAASARQAIARALLPPASRTTDPTIRSDCTESIWVTIVESRMTAGEKRYAANPARATRRPQKRARLTKRRIPRPRSASTVGTRSSMSRVIVRGSYPGENPSR